MGRITKSIFARKEAALPNLKRALGGKGRIEGKVLGGRKSKDEAFGVFLRREGEGREMKESERRNKVKCSLEGGGLNRNLVGCFKGPLLKEERMGRGERKSGSFKSPYRKRRGGGREDKGCSIGRAEETRRTREIIKRDMKEIFSPDAAGFRVMKFMTVEG